jgi:hypothetical protein
MSVACVMRPDRSSSLGMYTMVPVGKESKTQKAQDFSTACHLLGKHCLCDRADRIALALNPQNKFQGCLQA